MKPLAWDGVFWSGDLKLPGLARSALLLEIEGPQDFEPDDDDDDPDDDEPPLDPLIARAIAWLGKPANVARVAVAIRAAVTKQWAAIVASGDEPDKAPKRPPNNLDFINITIHPVKGGRLPYYGLGAHAKWAIEHGIGVMMHGARVVAIGQADTALDEHLAKADARRLSSRGRSRSPKRRASRGRPARPRRAR